MQAEQEGDISDGEIVEDENEESELSKKDCLKVLFPMEKKLQKNFRKSNQKDESEEDIKEVQSSHQYTLERKSFNKSLNIKDDKKTRHNAKRRRIEEYERTPKSERRRPNFARQDFCRDRPDFRQNISLNRGFKRNKLPTSLKYTVAIPSISYAENPRIDSNRNAKVPKSSSIEEKKDVQKIKQDDSPKTPSPLEDKNLSLTSPDKMEISKDETESNSQLIQNNNDFSCKESVPVVVESPPRSPVLQLPSTSDFTSSSLFREKEVRNICSFLSDIESEGYLSSFSMLNDLDDGQSDTEEKNNIENSNFLSSTLDENCQIREKLKDSDEDDDTSSTNSSTSSDSSSTSSESEEESSDTSSNEDITPFSSGFGRFSSDSSLQFSVPLAITKTTLEMQAKSLESSNIAKPSLFTTTACIRPSQIALKTGLIAPSFAVPFKIYSIRDISAAQLSLPSVTSTPQVSAQIKTSPKESKLSERAREVKRFRKSRSRSLERRRSIDREVRNRKNDRRRSPPSMTKRRSISPSVAKRRSLTPPLSHKNKNFPLRHSSPPPSGSRSRQRLSASSSKKFIQKPRKRSHSPQGENSRSNRPKHKVFRESERRDSPYCHERQSSDTATFSDDDSQASFRKHTAKQLDLSEISHSANEDSNFNSFYYAQNYSENYQEDYFMPIEEQQYYDDFYSASKNFINNYNLVDITQQRRDRQRAESNQIAVQVGNVLEIVPNAEIPQSDPSADVNESIEIDPKELKEKRKIARDRKRKLKKIRKDGLRKEIQRYFDEGINIEDSEEEELLIEPLKKSEEVIKSIIKSSSLESKKDRRVVFGDGFYPFESSDHEENSFQEKLNRKTFRKSVIKKRIKAVNTTPQKKSVESTKKQVEYYENIPPPSPPPGKPSEKFPQPKLKKISAELFASFPINLNPMYYFIQKIQQHHNGHNMKGSSTLSARNLNTSDPRLMSTNTNCYSRFS